MEIEKRLTFDGIVFGGFIIQSTKSDLIEGRKNTKRWKIESFNMFGRLAPVTFDISAQARFELIPTGERKKRTNQTINHNIGQFFFHSVCCVVLFWKENELTHYVITERKSFLFNISQCCTDTSLAHSIWKKNWFWLPNWNNHDFR